MVDQTREATGVRRLTRDREGRVSAAKPVLVTTAPENPRDELAARQRRYLITMGIRVGCFALAVLLYTLVPGAPVVRLIAAVLAMVLPWVAVVAANAGPQRRRRQPSTFVPTPPQALGSAADRPPER
jgi:hypothetical protein